MRVFPRMCLYSAAVGVTWALLFSKIPGVADEWDWLVHVLGWAFFMAVNVWLPKPTKD